MCVVVLRAVSKPPTRKRLKTPRRLGPPRQRARLDGVTDLSKLPVVLLIRDICAIYRRGYSTVRREIDAGTFRPWPFDQKPYRWSRFAVEQHLARRMADAEAVAPGMPDDDDATATT